MRAIVLDEHGGRTSVPVPGEIERALLNKHGEPWRKDCRTRCPTCRKGRLEESKPSDWPETALQAKGRAARRRVLKEARKNPLGKAGNGVVYRCTDCGGRVRVHVNGEAA